jgi:hypothetical protein
MLQFIYQISGQRARVDLATTPEGVDFLSIRYHIVLILQVSWKGHLTTKRQYEWIWGVSKLCRRSKIEGIKCTKEKPEREEIAAEIARSTEELLEWAQCCSYYTLVELEERVQQWKTRAAMQPLETAVKC